MSDRAKEGKYGQMAPCMKDGGVTTKQTAKAASFMQMEMSTMDNGRTIRLMDSESTAILMAPNMRDTGRKTSSTEKDLRLGQMEPDITASTLAV
jgi:hypothetical protein